MGSSLGSNRALIFIWFLFQYNPLEGSEKIPFEVNIYLNRALNNDSSRMLYTCEFTTRQYTPLPAGEGYLKYLGMNWTIGTANYTQFIRVKNVTSKDDLLRLDSKVSEKYSASRLVGHHALFSSALITGISCKESLARIMCRYRYQARKWYTTKPELQKDYAPPSSSIGISSQILVKREKPKKTSIKTYTKGIICDGRMPCDGCAWHVKMNTIIDVECVFYTPPREIVVRFELLGGTKLLKKKSLYLADYAKDADGCLTTMKHSFRNKINVSDVGDESMVGKIDFICKTSLDAWEKIDTHIKLTACVSGIWYKRSLTYFANRSATIELPCETKAVPPPKSRVWTHTSGNKNITVSKGGHIAYNSKTGTLTIRYLKAKHKGDYFCTLTEKDNTVTTMKRSLTVYLVPGVNLTSSNFRYGARAILTCIISGKSHGPPSWWLYDMPLVAKDTYVIESVALRHYGCYTCTAKNDIGEASDRLCWTYDLPRLTPKFPQWLGYKNLPLTFSCKIKNKIDPPVEDPKWFLDDKYIGVQKESYTIYNMTKKSYGCYKCVVKSPVGIGDHKECYPRPPLHTIQESFPPSLKFDGKSRTLSCKSFGYLDPPIGKPRWYLDGRFTGYSGENYTISTLTKKSFGCYNCTATSILGSVSKRKCYSLPPMAQKEKPAVRTIVLPACLAAFAGVSILLFVIWKKHSRGVNLAAEEKASDESKGSKSTHRTVTKSISKNSRKTDVLTELTVSQAHTEA